MLTAEQAFEVWREMLATDYHVEWKPALEPHVYIYAPGSLRACADGRDPDPLRAISKAHAAFVAATTEKGQA